MANWLRWFGYGLGVGAARVVLGDDDRKQKGSEGAGEPIRQQTEAQIREDEKRYDEDAKRLEAEDAAAKKEKKPRTAD